MRLLVDLQVHTVRQQNFDRMRVAQHERGDLAFDVGAVAGAHNVQLPHETGRHALNGVGGQRPRQPVQRGELVAVPLDIQDTVRLLEAHSGRNRHRQLAAISLLRPPNKADG